nr:endogenous retrovirus group K member 18 Pol protein [Oryctolagus cuniculus]XP_051674849.1 endogenous retrovirus group K member 18 Pol protein [Oryctolagus cuniculus]
MVLDLKDCFFSIPLHERDTQRFAFTVPAINHQGPDKRYQWTVLPQGMVNSPTICQLYVSQTIEPVRQQCSRVKIFHYMDDLLISAPSESQLNEAYKLMVTCLEDAGLQIAPEKVQRDTVVCYLGLRLMPEKVAPLEFTIATEGLKTLNDFQKLCGNLNWIRPYCKLTTEEMMPLFKILEGDPQLTSPRVLTAEARLVLQKVEARLKATQMERCDLAKPLEVLIFVEQIYPFAVIWQGGPLLFVYLHSHVPHIWYTQGSAVADLILTTIKRTTEIAGKVPTRCVVPFNRDAMEALIRECWQWAYIALVLQVEIDNHYPYHPFVTFVHMF